MSVVVNERDKLLQAAPSRLSAVNLQTNVTVTTTNIADNAVTTPKVADSAVTTPKVSDSAVTSTKIASGAIDVFAKFGGGLEPVHSVAALPSATGYTGPKTVLLTTDSKLYRYTGTAWTVAVPTADLTGQVTSSQITDGAVSELKLAANAVTAAKLAAGAVNTFDKFAAGFEPVSVVGALPSPTGYTGAKTVFLTTDNKLYRYTGTAWSAAVPTVDLTGQIAETQITDLAVSTPKLAAGAVTTAKITAGAVTANELAADSVIAGKIAAAAVVAGKIAANAVTATEIAAGSVTTAKIAALAVTTAELAAGAVTTAKITAGAVTATEIATDAVTAAKILAGSVTTAKLAAGAVTANELAAGSVTADKITAGAVTTAKLAAGAVTANEIAATTITTNKLVVGAVSAPFNASSANAFAFVADGATAIGTQTKTLTTTWQWTGGRVIAAWHWNFKVTADNSVATWMRASWEILCNGSVYKSGTFELPTLAVTTLGVTQRTIVDDWNWALLDGNNDTGLFNAINTNNTLALRYNCTFYDANGATTTSSASGGHAIDISLKITEVKV